MVEKISVIVPVYKIKEQYLKECIESISKQTYSNLEIILVDDGSPDNCGEICDLYAEKDSRIMVLHQKNQGVSMARNNAIQKATGEWITFIDADDWIEKNMCDCQQTVKALIGNAPDSKGFIELFDDGVQLGNALFVLLYNR